jgi:hypothetical protein
VKVVFVLLQIPVEEGPALYFINCTSPVFHVLTGTGKVTTQKLPTVRTACNTNEVVEEVKNPFDKHGCSEASVIHVTGREYYKHVYCLFDLELYKE